MEENRKADTLSKLAAMQCEGLTKGVLIEELNERSVDMTEVNTIIEEVTRTWMTPIQEYIEKRILPRDVTEAQTIQEKARNYTIEEGILYRKSYLGPLLRCIGIPTRRVIQEFDKRNKEALGLNLNLLEEQREITAIREARRKQQVEKYYDQRVHHKQFKVGEFVLRKNELSKVENTGKLGPKWEGPYEVVKTYGTGAYKLRSMDGVEIAHTWHSSNLRKYYM
ncbi:hypothetical protein Tco_0308235 [Tanacetum coccineum]